MILETLWINQQASGIINSIVYDRQEKGYRLEQIYQPKLTNGEILAICKILLDSRAFMKKEMDDVLEKLISCCVPRNNQKLVKDLISNEALDYKLSQAEKNGDTKEQALIHCGICSIEDAITAYVKKYAKTKKVKDLVESFQEVLESTQVLAQAKTQVATDEEAARACAERAASVKAKIADGKEAAAFKEKIAALNPMEAIEDKAEILKAEATRKTGRVFEPYGDVMGPENFIRQLESLHGIEEVPKINNPESQRPSGMELPDIKKYESGHVSNDEVKVSEDAERPVQGELPHLKGEKEPEDNKSTDSVSETQDIGNSIEAAENNEVVKNCPVENGTWEGERGNSKWVPNPDYVPQKKNPEQRTWEEILDKYGIDGINFKDREPDFSEISKGDVEIEPFSTNRDDNFDKADIELAKQKGCTPETEYDSNANVRFSPRTLLFGRTGECALLCDDIDEPDEGIAICVYPDEIVVPQDDYL